MSLTIACDYDNTFTSDPEFWEGVIRSALGYKVICVTGRKESHPIPISDYLVFDAVIYAGGELKEQAALEAGYKVDIWIDDKPGTIQRCAYVEPSPDSEL
jgi:hypothetical protein